MSEILVDCHMLKATAACIGYMSQEGNFIANSVAFSQCYGSVQSKFFLTRSQELASLLISQVHLVGCMQQNGHTH